MILRVDPFMSYHAAIDPHEAATCTTTRFYITMRASAKLALRDSHDTILRVFCLFDVLINANIANEILIQPWNHKFELHPDRFSAFIFVRFDDDSGIVSQ
jgi:hypothetical protein